MKRKLTILLILFAFLLSGCSDGSKPNDNNKMINQTSHNSDEEQVKASHSSDEERAKTFVENFSQNYPGFEMLDYIVGSDENAPIQLVAIVKNRKNSTSSTLFIVDRNGVGKVVLAGEYFSTYRKEDGLYLSENVISVSLDVAITDTSYEIHDFDITVTQEEKLGKLNTIYASNETIR